jgi:hypothetical protein
MRCGRQGGQRDRASPGAAGTSPERDAPGPGGGTPRPGTACTIPYENASVYSPFRRSPVLSFPMFLPYVHRDVDRGRSAG